MKRVQGSGLLVECVNPRLQKYVIRWDVQPYYRTDEKSGEEKQEGYDYYEKWIAYKPSIEEVKGIVLDGMNADIDKKILEGFVWKGMAVWLSSENQFNYKAAYDLAMMSQGQNLPSTFKFGTTENPVYHTFETLEDISDFYLSAMTYINQCLAEGWAAKDAVDWSVYEELLNPKTEDTQTENAQEENVQGEENVTTMPV